MTDLLWPHFRPLWIDLVDSGGKDLLVAGGYGLFLKQNWLSENQETPALVPIGRWTTNEPRVTKDLDLVVSLDVIAEEQSHRRVLGVLEKHGFSVTEKHPRWQFEKSVSEERKVIVEFHAQVPASGVPGLERRRERVKRKPSLGDDGFHAHANPEAVGCELHPFRFEMEGTPIVAPNALTWSIMKLTATQDRWTHSEDSTRDQEWRLFSREQAIKHAQDVCRVVAMVTRDESDAIPEVVDAIRATPEFARAAGIFSDLFARDDGRAAAAVSGDWRPDDFNLIRATLARWFEPALGHSRRLPRT